MPEQHFGDIILIESETLESKILGWFTGSKINHCAIRTGENEAESVEINKGKSVYDLSNLPPEYIGIWVLMHKDLTEKKRADMKQHYKMIGKEYDLRRIVTMGNRIIRGIPQDMKDLQSQPNYETCSSIPAFLHAINSLKLPISNIHYSQFMPHQFYDGKYFKIERVR